MTGALTCFLLFALDGGVVDAGTPPNDTEVIKELELLEDLDSLGELELLEAL